MRFLRYSLAGLFLVALTAGLFVYAGSLVYGAFETRMNDEPRPNRSRERVFAVTVVPAQVGQESPVLTTFGQIESLRTLEVRAAASGTVLELSENFVEGGEVSLNEILVQIDPAEAASALEKVRSDLKDAELEAVDAARGLELALDELAAAEEQSQLRQKAFERQNDLADRGVGTSAAVESAELAASSARQSVLTRRQAIAQAEARVNQSETRIARAKLAEDDAKRSVDNTVIKAEFSGTLSDVNIARGGLVSNNEQLAQLIDPTQLEVSFRISTAQYARLLDDSGNLRPADVTVILDVLGADLSAKGTISRDSAAVAEGQSGRLIFATLDAAPGFKPGDFVKVEIVEPPVNGVARLPAAALGADGALLVLTDGDRLEALPVDLVRRQGDDVFVQGETLNGRDVVAARTPLLGTGIRVNPLRGSEAQEIRETETVELDPARRERLIAAVEGNNRIPEQAKARILSALSEDKVPLPMVERLESRMEARSGQQGAQQDRSGQDQGASENAEMVSLSDERRAKIRAFVEANSRIPDEAKARILAQLEQDKVPAQMVQRIESRMGG